MTEQHGTAIVRVRDGKILDIDLADSRGDAERQVAEMNQKLAAIDLALPIRWAVVSFEVRP